jgi:hypothetical protein
MMMSSPLLYASFSYSGSPVKHMMLFSAALNINTALAAAAAASDHVVRVGITNAFF